jgi:hypothetical protein
MLKTVVVSVLLFLRGQPRDGVLLLLEKLQESPLLLGGGTFQAIETQVVQEQRGGAVVASNDRTANAGGDAANDSAANDSAANAGGHSFDDSAKVFPVESRGKRVFLALAGNLSPWLLHSQWMLNTPASHTSLTSYQHTKACTSTHKHIHTPFL